MGPEQFFMKLPPDLFATMFGRETFELVRGGPHVQHSETDLFAGLPG